MRSFDYSKLKDRSWDSEILGYVAQIHEYKGRQQVLLRQRAAELDRLVEIAKVQSTEASNEIEGIVTSDERLADIVLRNDAPRTHSENEIAGYRDALSAIHEDPSAFDLDETSVLGFHRTMMSHTLRGGGHYRIRDNAS